MEQVARALNALCRRWLDQQHQRELNMHISFVLLYRQRRNAAATKSHRRQTADSS